MDIQHKKNFLEKITELPVLPQHVQQLMSCVEDTEVDIQEVTQILQRDPSLTARVLLVANSPLYGMHRQVTRLGQAVMVLGLEAVRNIALSVSLFQMFKPNADLILKPDEFWKHSLVVACLARLIAKHLNFEDPDNAFTAGLLHDFGKIVMMKHFPKEFSLAVLGAKRQEGLLTELEKKYFGIDHTAVGKILGEHWNFPTSLTKTITHHHEKLKITWPAPLEDQDLSVVKIANNLAKLIPVGDSGNPFFEIQALQIARLAGLDLESLQHIFHQLSAELKHLGAFFDLSLEDSFVGVSKFSPKVALVVGDHEERSFLSLLLSAMGICAVEYTMNSFEEIHERAVIIDEELIPPYARKVQQEAIAVLNWKNWRIVNSLSMTSGQYHVSSLRHWMSEQLLQESQKIHIETSLSKAVD